MEEYVRQVNTNIELSQEIEKLNNQLEEKTYLYNKLSTESKYTIEKLHSIIKEVREYIEPFVELDTDVMLKGRMLKPVLEILDKVKENK